MRVSDRVYKEDLYKIITSFVDGIGTRHLIVNNETQKVHSMWKRLMEARYLAKALNKRGIA